ncbi:hypothetical protein LC613_36095 [Nostoc sphaeroides CHAB 2801]|uniref:hypothetical protein n=1 Tax=Nostoc sphaeroides TaxID=446679 RepID=UPI001E2E6D22|nr:hypothetical protein [Nostoc sphaeroides]MCC5632958.1 hypothetical protein [Nostoc sphaeroides CHAB 2801]
MNKLFKRISLEFRYGETSEVIVSRLNKPVIFGQNHPLVVVAGPCSVENEKMIVETCNQCGYTI